MYQYAVLAQGAVLIVRHSGKYEGAEADNAILEVARSLGAETMFGLSVVIHDLAEIESISLQDSDFARRAIFLTKLEKTLGLPMPLREYLPRLELLIVEPDKKELREIFRERQRRMSHPNLAIMTKTAAANDVNAMLIDRGMTDADIAAINWRSPPTKDSK